MTFDELFRYIAVEYLRDRPVANAVYTPSNTKLGFQGSTITQLMNEAEAAFCKFTHCILDMETASCCQIALVAGNRFYNLHRSVFRVDHAQLLDTVNNDEYTLTQRTFVPTISGTNVDTEDRIDLPKYWNASVWQGTARRIQFWPIANSTFTLQAQLVVYRTPLNLYEFPDSNMSEAEKTTALARASELPEEYQTSIGDYVLGRLLSSRDVDRHALKESQEAMRRWRETLIRARAERHIEANAPNAVAANAWV